MKKSIFKKMDDNPNSADSNTNTHTILDSAELMEAIPKYATPSKQPILNNQIEWRWRFFEIGSKKLIEMSYADKSDKRIFIDHTGDPIFYDMDESWDKYVVKTLYAYVDK